MEIDEYKAIAESMCKIFFAEFKSFLLDLNSEQEKKQKELLDKIAQLKDAFK